MANIYDKSSLVLIPSGTKTSKIFSQKPTNGDGDFTFSRSTAATRVNASGNIEKETENLLLHSNSFSNTWTNASSTETSGQAGYDGTNNAWLLTSSLSGGRISQSVSVSGVQTFSVYLKAGSRNWGLLVSTGTSAYFDLNNGVVGSGGTAPIDANIESVGGGWYRCSISANGSNAEVRIYPALADNDVSGTGSIYMQDAQLEQGLVARDYIETTTTAIYGGITDNVPRLDYTDSSCPALLLEPQRTNTDPNGEYLANRPIVVNVSTTTNSIDSPEGVTNATLITNNTTSGQHQLTDNTFSVTSGTDYTISLFLKYRDAQYVRLQFGGTPFGSTNWQNFDVLNGTKGSKGGGISTADSSIEDYGNGWYRCSLTADATATGSNGAFQIRILENDNTSDIPSFAGSGLSTYAWGAQFEQGSYATSYIPTYGSSVSRVADYSVRSDMQDYVSADEGTWFMHFKDLFFDITGTGQGSINLVYTSGNQIEFIQRGNLQYKIAINNSTAVDYLDGEDKVAIAWSTSGLAIYINGESKYTNSSSVYANPYSVFELTRVDRRPRVDMKQILFFKTRLSNQELAALTTI